MAARWLSRLAVLFALPVILAAVDATVRTKPGPARNTPTEAHTPTARPIAPALPGERVPDAVVVETETEPDVAATPPPTPAVEASAPTEGTLEWVVAAYEQGTAFIVDARPLHEYVESHIPGAYHLPFEAFLKGQPAVLDLLPQEFPIIIYCGGGDCDASHKVQEMLTNYGYVELHVFEPGYPAWIEAGLPTEQGEPEF